MKSQTLQGQAQDDFKKKYNLVDEGSDILSTKMERFDFNDPPIDPEELGKDLLAHMRYFGGIGLSANQLGLPYRVFVMEGDPGFVCFNPRITAHAGDEVLLEEGCLSYPGLYIKKKRPAMIRCNFQDPYGNSITKRFSGISSRIFQHEFEHLEGANFLEGVSRLALDNARRKQRNLLRRVKREVSGRSKHGTGRRR